MDIDFSAVRKKAKEKYGPKSGEFQEDRIDFGKVRERAKEKYGTPVYDKQLGSQGHQPKDTETFSVGTAVPSGPSSPPTQHASTYAASSQGELQTRGFRRALTKNRNRSRKSGNGVGPFPWGRPRNGWI